MLSATHNAVRELKNKAKVLRNTLRNSKTPPVAAASHALNDVSPYFVPSAKEKPGKGKKRKASVNLKNLDISEIKLAGVEVSNVEDTKQKQQPDFKKSRGEFKKSRQSRDDDNERTLFIGNLSLSVKEKELRKLCSAYGEVSTIRFRSIFGKNQGMSKGVAAIRKSYSDDITHCCAYVVFKEILSAQNAVKGMKGIRLGNRHIHVSLANNKEGRFTSHSIHVSYLPRDADEEEVRLYFRRYGPVETLRLVRDRDTGQCRGFGFVQFENADGASLCLADKSHVFKKKQITVAKCFKKDKARKASSESFYSQEVKKVKKEKKASEKGKKEKSGEKKKSVKYVKNKIKTSTPKRKRTSLHKSSII